MFKKLLLSTSIILLSYTALAWNIKFVNQSDGEVEVKFNYAGSGICAPNRGVVAKGQEINFDASICCGEGYWLRKSSGIRVGNEFSGGVGGNTCVNHKITISNGADGTLNGHHETYY